VATPEPPSSALSPRTVALLTAAISAGAIGFLVWLVYFREAGGAFREAGGAFREAEGGRSAGAWLPYWNALMNAIAARLLVSGRREIRAGRRARHARLMLSALAASALFLVGYVAYHALHGDTRFAGQGLVRPFYFSLLISHIALSVVVFPAILWTLYLAVSDRIAAHRRIARWTWAGWMYVSLTGVAVFVMLHVIDWSA
jgi:putative membrane protein